MTSIIVPGELPLHSFKYFVENFLTEAKSGKKTADIGLAHEFFTKHAFNSLLRQRGKKKPLGEKISNLLFGTEASKGTQAGRLRISKLSEKHPLRVSVEKLEEIEKDKSRSLYRNSAHTASAIAHYAQAKYGDIESIKHVGKETAGSNTLSDESGNPIKTNADLLISIKGNKKVKFLGGGLKYSESESGGGSTKIYSPTHNTVASKIDAARAHEDVKLPLYNGEGLKQTLEKMIHDHSHNEERDIYTRHHKTLKSVFGDSENGVYDSSLPVRPLKKVGLSKVRRIVENPNHKHHEAISSFYKELSESNQGLQTKIAHHIHSAASDVLTGLGNDHKKRLVAANLYRSLNNAEPSIPTFVVSTVHSTGMNRPQVHIYNHNETVESHIKKVNDNSEDYKLTRDPETASFKVGDINFGVDRRPGTPSIMINGKVQNTNFKHEASYVEDEDSVKSKGKKKGNMFTWDKLRQKT